MIEIINDDFFDIFFQFDEILFFVEHFFFHIENIP